MEDKKDVDLGVVIEDKTLVLWKDVLKGAEKELANTEEIYFKNKTFNEAMIELAKLKIAKFTENGTN